MHSTSRQNQSASLTSNTSDCRLFFDFGEALLLTSSPSLPSSSSSVKICDSWPKTRMMRIAMMISAGEIVSLSMKKIEQKSNWGKVTRDGF